MFRAFQIKAMAPRAQWIGRAIPLALLGALSSCSGKTGVIADPSVGGVEVGTQGNDSRGSSLVQAQLDAAALEPGALGAGADPSGGAWRIIEVPTASNAPSIVKSPLGWLALSRRVLGDGKAPRGYESVLYRSTDGVHWTSLPLGPEARNKQFWGLAYGAGTYAMVGQLYGGHGVYWSSPDAQHWSETSDASAAGQLGGGIAYAQGRFFHVGFNYVAESDNGRDWQVRKISLLQEGGAAYGNGVYLLVGNGPMQVSQNGWDWQEYPLDCTRPGTCTTDPGGGIHQPYHTAALFAEGRFYTEELSSEDGIHWQAEPGLRPTTYVSGYFLGDLGGNALSAWRLGSEVQRLQVLRPTPISQTALGRRDTSIGVLDRDQPLPDNVNVEFEDGLTCETATCVLLGDRLLLIPPAGTPPLPDRVPRTADGNPLLSDDCPFSSQIACADYATRTGCACHPDAPSQPAACEDVSRFRCAGRFTRQANEWQLDEVADGGCSCDAVDPNQPASFGVSCLEDASVCGAPLQCLSVDSVGGGGAPPLPRSVCTSRCNVDADCPSWQATGFCAGPVQLHCSNGSCQPRSCQ